MAHTLNGSNDLEKLEDLSSKTYKEQAVWFLNAFWEDFAKDEAERLWKFKHQCDELDHAKKAQGCALDELQAHRFLEKFNETMTVQSMRDKLRSTGAIGAKVKLVPLIHILIIRFNVDWHTLVNAPQGSKEEIAKAQQLLDEVQAAFQESEARAAEAAAALKEAKAREADAKAREAEAKAAEADAKAREAEAHSRAEEAKATEAEAVAKEEELRAAKEEQEAALAEVKAQEDAYNNKTAELKRASEEGGLVSRNKAKNELAQHLQEDPLPLRRAKITLEAAVKKAEKAAQIAADARSAAEESARQAEAAAQQASSARAAAEQAARQAEQARAQAEQARQHSERAKEAAEEALEEAKRKVEEAEAYLQEVKARLPQGAIWWMERELHEARAYLPKSKGGYNKNEK
ncbi:Merozoite surface protein 3a [Balamuthia mandrillaris]